MFIAYQKQRGILYARLMESYREDGRIRKRSGPNLGRVIDKELGIYQSRERGVFTYTRQVMPYVVYYPLSLMSREKDRDLIFFQPLGRRRQFFAQVQFQQVTLHKPVHGRRILRRNLRGKQPEADVVYTSQRVFCHHQLIFTQRHDTGPAAVCPVTALQRGGQLPQDVAGVSGRLGGEREHGRQAKKEGQ